ncbi:MAG: (d)CMP kinase [Gammaproteobacteria bacterium TMED182]|nr:cytidylate kinase [Gammaproteobacteria bacterium]RPG51983.1 MAG: (d)CMP kinase [Gammaproteobacteria bacterium TMED182]
MSEIKVITIDGPSGAGKGAVTQTLAARTGFHVLDSGALYRLVGLAARQSGLDLLSEDAVASLASGLDIAFEPAKAGPEPLTIWLSGREVTHQIRTDEAGVDASTVAALPKVRDALGDLQLSFRKPPGLIADGRDMGTVVFKDAQVKIFLTASASVRADRRYNQLKTKGMDVSLADLLDSIRARDARDSNRSTSPLVPAEDATIIDSSDLSLAQVHARVWSVIENSDLIGANVNADEVETTDGP